MSLCKETFLFDSRTGTHHILHSPAKVKVAATKQRRLDQGKADKTRKDIQVSNGGELALKSTEPVTNMCTLATGTQIVDLDKSDKTYKPRRRRASEESISAPQIVVDASGNIIDEILDD